MRTGGRIWASRVTTLTLAALLGFGSAQPAAAQTPGMPADQPLVLPVLPAPKPRQVLSLDQLTELAAGNHPDLAVARAKLLAAQGKYRQAGLYLNPHVGPRTDDWGRSNPIGNPGLVFSQELVTAGKLRWAQAAAAFGVQAADYAAVTRWFDVLTRLRVAYYEVLTAERDVQATKKILAVANEVLDTAKRFEKAGVGNRPDVIRAQVELDQNAIRLTAAQRRLEASRRLLAAAAGVPALPHENLAGTLEAPPPRLDWQALLERALTRSSEVQEAQARVQEAEQLWRRAWAERVPNVTLSATPFYDGSEREAKLQLSIVAPLPIFNRNQGNIVAAQADFVRAGAEARQIELRLSERLALAFQRYQTAFEQEEVYQKRILPNANEARKLIEFGYAKGDPKYNYTAVLQAQQVLFQAELAYVQVLGELWRALSELSGIVQEERLLGQ